MSSSSEISRMREQCDLWGRWLQAPPALPGRPCCFVNASSPEKTFGVPEGARSSQNFQPFGSERKNWHRFHKDSLLPGGTGPVPSLSTYLSLLRLSRLQRRQRVHIVQIGANRGGSEMNEWVHAVLDENPSWTATVVEPVERTVAILRRNYHALQHRVEPIQAAVSTFTGPCEMWVGRRGDDTEMSTLGLGPLVHGPRCFESERECRFFREMIRQGKMLKTTVACVTMADLLERRRIRDPVDLLVIDTEMFDYTLLRSIRFDAVRPLALEFETKAMSMQQGAEIAALLSLSGYLCRFQPYGDMFPEGDDSHEPEERTLRRLKRTGRHVLLDSRNRTLGRLTPRPPLVAPPPNASKRLQMQHQKRLDRRLFDYNLLEVVCYRMTL